MKLANDFRLEILKRKEQGDYPRDWAQAMELVLEGFEAGYHRLEEESKEGTKDLMKDFMARALRVFANQD